MARRRSHTKRRKHRGGWEWSDLNPFKAFSRATAAEGMVPAVGTPLDSADRMAQNNAPPLMNSQASNALGTSPLGVGETSTGGRRRRRGSRKTKRRGGGKY